MCAAVLVGIGDKRLKQMFPSCFGRQEIEVAEQHKGAEQPTDHRVEPEHRNQADDGADEGERGDDGVTGAR